MKGLGVPAFALAMFTACGITLGQYKVLEAVWSITLASGGGTALGLWLNWRQDRNEIDFWQSTPDLYAYDILPTHDREAWYNQPE